MNLASYSNFADIIIKAIEYVVQAEIEYEITEYELGMCQGDSKYLVEKYEFNYNNKIKIELCAKQIINHIISKVGENIYYKYIYITCVDKKIYDRHFNEVFSRISNNYYKKNNIHKMAQIFSNSKAIIQM